MGSVVPYKKAGALAERLAAEQTHTIATLESLHSLCVRLQIVQKETLKEVKGMEL